MKNDIKKEVSVISEIKISLILLKSNWKAFFWTNLFAVFALTIIMFIFSFTYFFTYEFGIGDWDVKRQNYYIFFTTNTIIWSILLIIFYTFLTCQFGLAYDIITSGDEFTEFKSSFSYFKKHWIGYLGLSILIHWIQLLFDNRYLEKNLTEFLLPLVFGKLDLQRFEESFRLINFLLKFNQLPFKFSGVDEIFYSLILILLMYIHLGSIFFFVLIIPGITRGKSLKTAFNDNFKILVYNKQSVIKVWLVYYFIFYLPSSNLINFIALFFLRNYGETRIMEFYYFYSIISLFFYLYTTFLAPPMMAIIATRMYNSAKDILETEHLTAMK
jgi:hypothetical protein